MNNTTKSKKRRNLNLCPITPDPPEILDLIADLKAYVKTIDFQNDSIYKAYYEFDYDGTTYRMDDSVLSTSPAIMFEASWYIIMKLSQLGADNIYYFDRED